MSFIITPTDPNQGDGSSRYPEPSHNGGRGPLRHLLIGTPPRIRATQRHLHARRYKVNTPVAGPPDPTG